MIAKPKRPVGSGSLYLRGSIWWCKFHDHGRAIRVSTEETNRGDAQKFLTKKLAEVASDEYRDTRKLRYETLVRLYYRDYEVKKRKSLRFDKKGNPYLDKVNRLEKFFRMRLVNSIKKHTLVEYILDQRKQGLSDASINRSLAALKHMFKLAQADEMLVKIPKFEMLAENPPRQGCLRREDYAKLAAVLPKELQLPTAIAWYTGARLGEVLGLQWTAPPEDEPNAHGWIDRKAGVIHLLRTKSGQPRDLPLLAPLRPMVAERALLAERFKCPYVCFRVNRDKRTYEHMQSFRKAFTHACEKAGLGKRLFHDLRRSAIKCMIDSGVSQTQAMRISGHRTVSTFRRYSDIFNESEMAAAAKKLEAFHAEPLPVGTDLGTIDDEDLPIQ
jgi:integrase